MSSQTDPVVRIQELVRARHYRIGLHAVRHMVEEGFDENQRYLMLGYFHFTLKTISPLHLLCDLSKPNVVDIVTAHIPQRPWWISPARRGRERR